jgi:hypothetical protein
MAVSVPNGGGASLFSCCRSLCKAPQEIRRGAAPAKEPVASAKNRSRKASLPSVYFYIIIKTI